MERRLRKNWGFYGCLGNEDWFWCEKCRDFFEDRSWEVKEIENVPIRCPKCGASDTKSVAGSVGILG